MEDFSVIAQTLHLVNIVRVPGVIFVVDSNDRERIGEAQDELLKMLSEDELRGAVVLVLANKQVSVNVKGHSRQLIICYNTQYINRNNSVSFCFKQDHILTFSNYLLFLGPSECHECSRNHGQVEPSLNTEQTLVHPGNVCVYRGRTARWT